MNDVALMKEKHLKKLTKNVRNFFNSFRELHFENLSDKKIQEYLDNNHLSFEDMKSQYSEGLR